MPDIDNHTIPFDELPLANTAEARHIASLVIERLQSFADEFSIDRVSMDETALTVSGTYSRYAGCGDYERTESSYSMPLDIFLSDTCVASWISAQDAERARLAAEKKALARLEAAASAARLAEAAELALYERLHAKLGSRS